MSRCATIRCLGAPSERELEELSTVLEDCVQGGASVGFMLPLSRAQVQRFWQQAGASAARGERVILVAENVAGTIVGTVQVVWAQSENQPHRADLAKLLVHRRARRQGVGAKLIAAAEQATLCAGRSLLVLDTVSGGDAERLYRRCGWEICGRIPEYALWPEGGFCTTTVFYKQLRGAS